MLLCSCMLYCSLLPSCLPTCILYFRHHDGCVWLMTPAKRPRTRLRRYLASSHPISHLHPSKQNSLGRIWQNIHNRNKFTSSSSSHSHHVASWTHRPCLTLLQRQGSAKVWFLVAYGGHPTRHYRASYWAIEVAIIILISTRWEAKLDIGCRMWQWS